ncbi:hypothetical protein [Haloprofundus marisrubri]|nr:hypothetical protein [Haloprofundus marisrubri]
MNWKTNYADHCRIAGNGFIRASRWPPAQFEDARENLNSDFRIWARRASEEAADAEEGFHICPMCACKYFKCELVRVSGDEWVCPGPCEADYWERVVARWNDE